MNKQEATDYVEKELREYFIDQESIGQKVTEIQCLKKIKSILIYMQDNFVFTDTKTPDQQNTDKARPYQDAHR